MSRLVLLRHGQSTANAEERFSGQSDVSLTEYGRQQAREAAEWLAAHHLIPQRAFCSTLTRARETLSLLLDVLELEIPVTFMDQLKERDSGEVTGLLKSEARALYGEERARSWSHAWSVIMPGGESFAQVEQRVVACYEAQIAPHLVGGETVLISGHGHVFRALVKHITQRTIPEAESLYIPNAKPLVFEWEEGEYRPFPSI